MEENAHKFSNSGVDPIMACRIGIKNLAKTVALQLAGNGICVNAIAPDVNDSRRTY